MKATKIIIGILIILLFVGIGLWGAAKKHTGPGGQVQSGEVSIVLTEEGFSPKTIRIRKGTTITLTTNVGRFFWPASDLHPSHGIYPAFDPKKPIPAAESWSFTFDRVGSWDFHDHLSPYYTGTITVIE